MKRAGSLSRLFTGNMVCTNLKCIGDQRIGLHRPEVSQFINFLQSLYLFQPHMQVTLACCGFLRCRMQARMHR